MSLPPGQRRFHRSRKRAATGGLISVGVVVATLGIGFAWLAWAVAFLVEVLT